ncbi:Scr1 family TA system antitoxin-like transcriptional regulator [Streptomyces sp. NPDC059788]|uniref:helix-turn-helix domain-containing protein n=1 Tax=Streptomyces sp. NPDC059788 TaxID=3346948 RepID=UPI00365822FE
MAAKGAEPSPARVHVGGLISSWRQQAGMTQKELARETHVSESLEGAYERAERIPSAGFLIEADRLTVAKGVLESCVSLMEQESSRDQFLEWKALEAEALSLSGYQSLVLPGLLQATDYVSSLFRTRVPAYSKSEIDRLVEERLARKSTLIRDPAPTVSFVVEQAVFERPIGGAATFRRCLLHIVKTVRELDHVMLQVMPTNVDEHAGLNGPLDMLFSPDGRYSIFMEGQGKGRLLTRPAEANQYAQRLGALRSQAMTPKKSLELIERLAG